MTTLLLLIIVGFAAHYLWREYGSLRHMQVDSGQDTPWRRRQVLLDLIKRANACVTIADYRTSADSVLYNNTDVLNAVNERRKTAPHLMIELATACPERTNFSQAMDADPLGRVKRGILPPESRGMFMLADGGEEAYVVNSWGTRGTRYDMSRGVSEQALKVMLRDELEVAGAVFDAEARPQAPEDGTGADQVVQSSPGGMRLRRK
ncbi:MAG: hypothetical protein OXG35_22385 [Acidobacteria bacterium]|nr:hypothetical protein [Acidobacteriota bacterium]